MIQAAAPSGTHDRNPMDPIDERTLGILANLMAAHHVTHEFLIQLISAGNPLSEGPLREQLQADLEKGYAHYMSLLKIVPAATGAMGSPPSGREPG